jgi:3-deoxy-manno-octulosonate cytidylyltransferase (CMP-KDO synthetase)
MKKILAVIPARLASTRLPEKALKDIVGKTLVQRSWERAKASSLVDKVVVATDSQQIVSLVESFGGEAVMTSAELQCGSERVLAAAEILAKAENKTVNEMFSIIVNNQGDMPFLPTGIVDGLVKFLSENTDRFQMATIVSPLLSEEHFLSPNVVKAVVTSRNEALYFSRAPIPFPRGENERMSFESPDGKGKVFGFKHFGLYAFTPAGLMAYATSELSPLESVEKLEQLRVLEMGARVGVHIVGSDAMKDSVEVDTQSDLERARAVAKIVEEQQ